jgi:hypothetical protein
MADIVTNAFLEGQALGELNFNTDQFAWSLLYYSVAPLSADLVTAETYASVSAHELPTGNGYVTGGVSVTTSAYVDPVTQDIVYACESPSWIASAGSIGPFNYGLMYDVDTGKIIYFYDFLKNYTVNDGGIVKINIDVNGLVRAKRSCG